MRVSALFGLAFGVVCAGLFAAFGGPMMSSVLVLIGFGLVAAFMSITVGAAAQAMKTEPRLVEGDDA